MKNFLEKNKNAIKIFVMAIIGFISSMIADTESISFAFVVLSTVIFSVQYGVKNWLMPSKSDFNKLDGRDILSGVILAVCMAISTTISQIIIDGTIVWALLWKTSLGATIGYFAKTFKMTNNIDKGNTL